MSDFVTGAIIGSLSAIIGSVIGAFLTYKSTKIQIQSRALEQRQQIEHTEKEARRNRLIDARKEYLTGLSKGVTVWIAELGNFLDQISSIGYFLENVKQHPFLYTDVNTMKNEFREELEKIIKRLEKFRAGLEMIRGQLSDTKLIQLIDDALMTETKIKFRQSPILNQILRSWVSESNDDEIKAALSQSSIMSTELRIKIEKINKRIEELLIGDDTL